MSGDFTLGSGLWRRLISNSLHDTSGQPTASGNYLLVTQERRTRRYNTNPTHDGHAGAPRMQRRGLLRQGGQHHHRLRGHGAGADSAWFPSISELQVASTAASRVACPRGRDAIVVRRYRSTQAPTNGTCACDEGFEWDPDYGSCGRPQFNTSAWTGLQRCPGYVTKDTALDPVDVLNLRYVYIADASNSTADEILAAKRKAGANISSLSVPGGMYTNRRGAARGCNAPEARAPLEPSQLARGWRCPGPAVARFIMWIARFVDSSGSAEEYNCTA